MCTLALELSLWIRKFTLHSPFVFSHRRRRRPPPPSPSPAPAYPLGVPLPSINTIASNAQAEVLRTALQSAGNANPESINPLVTILSWVAPWAGPQVDILEAYIVGVEVYIFKGLQNIVMAIIHAINDPWAPSEFWTIPLWFALYQKGLLLAYLTVASLKKAGQYLRILPSLVIREGKDDEARSTETSSSSNSSISRSGGGNDNDNDNDNVADSSPLTRDLLGPNALASAYDREWIKRAPWWNGYGKSYDKSVFATMEVPMRNLGWVFTISYLHDQIKLIVGVMTGGADVAHAPGLLALADNRAFLNVDNVIYIAWLAHFFYVIKEWYMDMYRKRVDPTGTHAMEVDIFDKIITILVSVVCGVGALSILGLDSGAFFLSSVGGLAISLASKDLLENLVAGIIIVNKGHCQVGEIVKVGNMAGQVLKVGWLMTDFREMTGLTKLHVPNSTIVKSGIEILTLNTHRKVKQNVKIDYQHLEKMPAIIADVMEAYKHIDKLETFTNAKEVRSPFHKPRCFISSIDETGINMTLAYLVGPVRKRGSRGGSVEAKVRTDVNMALGRILNKHGVTFAPESVQVMFEDGVGARGIPGGGGDEGTYTTPSRVPAPPGAGGEGVWRNPLSFNPTN